MWFWWVFGSFWVEMGKFLFRLFCFGGRKIQGALVDSRAHVAHGAPIVADQLFPEAGAVVPRTRLDWSGNSGMDSRRLYPKEGGCALRECMESGLLR